MEAIVDWRKSASSTGTFVSIIMTGTVYEVSFSSYSLLYETILIKHV